MPTLQFEKYHGAGNDFILMDDRSGTIEPMLTEQWIARACDRHFGIGADGLMLLQQGKDGADFFMRYYNSDGRISTFCGNGGRCIVAYALALGVHQGECIFSGTDGLHQGRVHDDGCVTISMIDVHEVVRLSAGQYELYTGSPHYVSFEKAIDHLDMVAEGRAVRYSDRYAKEGINVNFAEEVSPGSIKMRTYERGVENETLACGTGVVAAALAYVVNRNKQVNQVQVSTPGGQLRVEFVNNGSAAFQHILLTGPVQKVFVGEIDI